jgi:chromosome segregation ATPase
MESPGDQPFLTWAVRDSTFSLDYDNDVLLNVAMSAMDAFCALPYGGLETGGLLLGRFEGGHVTITGSVPFVSNHAAGPWFTLSDMEQRQFGDIVAVMQRNPGSKPVGWYRSVKQRQVRLAATDLEIHRRFFPEPWQVVLVLQPSASYEIRAGFFHRNAEGALRTDATARRFSIETVADEEGKSAAEEQAPAAPVAAAPAPCAEGDEARPPSRKRSLLGTWLSRLRPPRDVFLELHTGDNIPGAGTGRDAAAEKAAADIAERRAENDRRAAQLDAAQAEGQLASLREKIAALEKSLAALRAKAAEWETSAAGQAERLARAEQDAASLREQKEAEATRAGRAESELAALWEETAALEASLKERAGSHIELETLLAALRQQKEAETARAAAAEAELAKLREKSTALEASLATQTDRAAGLEKDLASLHEHSAQGEASLQNQSKRNAQLETDLAISRRQVQDAEAELAALRQAKVEAETTLAQTERDFTESQGADELRKDLASLREHVSGLEEALAERAADHARLELETGRLRQEKAQIETELARQTVRGSDESDSLGLRQENRRLEAALAAEKERSRRTERDLRNIRDAWLNDVRRK